MADSGAKAPGFNLGVLLGLEHLFGQDGAVVVARDPFGEKVWLRNCFRDLELFRLRLQPVTLDGFPVDAESAGERLNRGEEALLEPGHEQRAAIQFARFSPR